MTTNITINSSHIIEPEEMNSNMRLVILSDGTTKFVDFNKEYIDEGLALIVGGNSP